MNNSWLPRALEDSRARGFLGPASIEVQIEHALGFAQCWEGIHTSPPESFLDLGSGGGLPGLVLLERWGTRAVLIDSMEKRTRFLKDVLAQAEAPQSGEVITGRAEELAREAFLSGTFDLVTARSFGPPAVTAECAARFLKVGGTLVVSEPPDDSEVGRWNVEILAALGLKALGRVRYGAAFQILTKTKPTPKDYPRAIGTPNKLPLF
ncbi:MAG: RsmG family class I SAM-dependent methyltransferase [Acidimicrobiales bacterium]